MLGGAEFVKGEWRQVPAGSERQALANDKLDCRATGETLRVEQPKAKEELVDTKSKAKG